MENPKCLPVGALLLIASVVSPAAVIIVDDFNVPVGGQAVCAGAGCAATPSSSSLALPAVNVIGGERDIAATRLAGGGRVDGNANAFDLGNLVFGSVSATGQLTTQYDGSDADPLTLGFGLNGGAGVNATGMVGWEFLISEDVDTGGTLQFTLYTDATNFISFTDLVPALTLAGSRLIPLSSFTQTGTFDLSAVRAIQVVITGNANLDLSINYFQLTDSLVPEPLTGILVGSALLGLAFWGKSRRQAQL
ncbi:MAG: hypothetical protein ACKV22_15100 [Bryobacteraceae bacterium]